MIESQKILARIEKLEHEIVRLRREFHQIPELGFEEFETSKKIQKYLEKLPLSVRKNVGKTGVVALLQGARTNPVILYRADMDALPIQELNDVEYCSKNPGKMHACGHDGHIAMALITAKALSEFKNELPGSIKFVFQPAEETVNGAKRMIDDGALENPAPQICFGIHLWNRVDVGKVVVQSGPVMAASNLIDVKIKGKLSHAAMPEGGADSLVAASAFIQQIQTIISRRLDPREKAVISFGKISGGQARNTIGGEFMLKGTIRTFSRQVAEFIDQEIRKIANGIELGHDVKIEIRNEESSPALINDPKITAIASSAAEEIVGKENLISDYQPQMGSEDFSEFLNRVPGCFIFVGSKNDKTGKNAPHHNPYFDIDETSLAIGAKIAVNFILKSLQNFS